MHANTFTLRWTYVVLICEVFAADVQYCRRWGCDALLCFCKGFLIAAADVIAVWYILTGELDVSECSRINILLSIAGYWKTVIFVYKLPGFFLYFFLYFVRHFALRIKFCFHFFVFLLVFLLLPSLNAGWTSVLVIISETHVNILLSFCTFVIWVESLVRRSL